MLAINFYAFVNSGTPIVFVLIRVGANPLLCRVLLCVRWRIPGMGCLEQEWRQLRAEPSPRPGSHLLFLYLLHFSDGPTTPMPSPMTFSPSAPLRWHLKHEL